MLAPLDHYRYLTTGRRRLLEAVKLLAPDQYVREFPFGLHTVRRTLHHMAGAEWFEITVVIPSRQQFKIKTTALKTFTQFCYHEVHHRSQVMAMLRQLHGPVETLDFLLLTAEAFEEVG